MDARFGLLVTIFFNHVLAASGQLLSLHQTFNQRPDASLKCWGDIDDYREGLKLPRSTRGKDLAAICGGLPTMMECGYERDPGRPYYANIGYKSPGRNGLYAMAFWTWPWNADDSFTVMSHALADLCSIKCACAQQDPVQPLDRYDQRPPNATITLNFDTLTGSQNPPGMQADLDNAQYKYGLQIAEDPWTFPRNEQIAIQRPLKDWPGNLQRIFGISQAEAEREHQRRYQNFYRPPTDQTSALASYAYVGDPANRPTCPTDNDVAEDLGEVFDAFEHSHLLAQGPMSTNALCAHQFYGGRSRGNLGAVCVLPKTPRSSGQQQQRSLSIEDVRKAPQFTNDYFPPQLLQLTVVKAVEAYCASKCYCEGEDEDEIEAREKAWYFMAKGIKMPDTELNQAVTVDEQVLAQGGGEITPLPDQTDDNPPSTNDAQQTADSSSSSSSPTPQQADQMTAPGMQAFEVEAAPLLGDRGGAGCSSNADCSNGEVCIVKLEETLEYILQWAGRFLTACIARSAINPHSRDYRGGGGGGSSGGLGGRSIEEEYEYVRA